MLLCNHETGYIIKHMVTMHKAGIHSDSSGDEPENRNMPEGRPPPFLRRENT